MTSTSTYTRISVVGKTKSTASGGKGKAPHASKKAYYMRNVGKETKRTGTKRTTTSHPQNFDFKQPLQVVAKAA